MVVSHGRRSGSSDRRLMTATADSHWRLRLATQTDDWRLATASLRPTVMRASMARHAHLTHRFDALRGAPDHDIRADAKAACHLYAEADQGRGNAVRDPLRVLPWPRRD